MAPVFPIANQKGGVGKTTTATTLAHALGLAGRRVLLVDLDPQANATSGLGLAPPERTAALDPGAAPRAVVETAWPNVSCLPAARDLGALGERFRSAVLREALSRIPADRFDAVFLDCPPSLGPLTRAALEAGDAVLIPIQCEYYPLEGLVRLLGAVRAAARANPGLSVAGIVLTMFDPRADLSHEVEAEIRAKLPHRVFRTAVPRDPAVAEAPSHCLSVFDYAPPSPGSRAYAELAAEFLDAVAPAAPTSGG